MPADLTVALSRGSRFLQIHAAQNGVFPEFSLDLQRGLLRTSVPLRLLSVRKQAVLHVCFPGHMIGRQAQTADGKRGIRDPLIYLTDMGDDGPVSVRRLRERRRPVHMSQLQGVGKAQGKGHGFRNQPPVRQLQTERVRHFLHHQKTLFVAVVPRQYLPAGNGAAFRAVCLDVRHGHALPPPGVIDQKLRVHAEHLIKHVLVRLRHILHGQKPKASQAVHRAASDPPEIRQRPMLPQGLPVQLFRQETDMILRVLGRNVKRHLRQIQVRSDPRRSRYPRLPPHILHDRYGKLPGGHSIQAQIFRHIQKGFVDGIDMDILLRHISQINGVDIGGIFNIQLHPRRRHDIGDLLRDLKDPAAVLHP